MKLAPGKFTELVPGWAPAIDRVAQAERLQSLVDEANAAIAAGAPGHPRLFRPQMREVLTERAMEWLDSILLPEDPSLSFVVRVWSRDCHAEHEGYVGLWRGFHRGWLYSHELLLVDPESSGCSRHMPPGNLIDVRALELHSERDDDDYWCDG